MNINDLKNSLPEGVTLVAVSKTHSCEAIMNVYNAGQRIFGENRPQELKTKYDLLPKDIRWHMIGHLQTNKVKYIAPFVEMIQSVDSDRLLAVINNEAKKNNRVIDVLLEVHVAAEETKSGWDGNELRAYLAAGKWREYGNVRIRGLMTVGSLTASAEVTRNEFSGLKRLFDELKAACFCSAFEPQSVGSDPGFDTLSMGMTSDYPLAIECGANMIRIGSLIFGAR